MGFLHDHATIHFVHLFFLQNILFSLSLFLLSVLTIDIGMGYLKHQERGSQYNWQKVCVCWQHDKKNILSFFYSLFWRIRGSKCYSSSNSRNVFLCQARCTTCPRMRIPKNSWKIIVCARSRFSFQRGQESISILPGLFPVL